MWQGVDNTSHSCIFCLNPFIFKLKVLNLSRFHIWVFLYFHKQGVDNTSHSCIFCLHTFLFSKCFNFSIYLPFLCDKVWTILVHLLPPTIHIPIKNILNLSSFHIWFYLYFYKVWTTPPTRASSAFTSWPPILRSKRGSTPIWSHRQSRSIMNMIINNWDWNMMIII